MLYVRSFIESSLKLLKSGGRLIIGAPYNNPYLYVSDKYHTLNLPPHHVGLWNKSSFKSLEKYFQIEVKSMHIEPLSNDAEYFWDVQLDYLFQHFNVLYLVLKKIPFFVKRYILFFLRRFVTGRNILVILKKQ